MTKKLFDPTKPVQTRGGCPARILCTDRKGADYQPIVALVTMPEGQETVRCYGLDGGYVYGRKGGSTHDLVNVPERTSRWVNAYKNGFGLFCSSKSDAIAARNGPKEYTGLVECLYEDGLLVDVKFHPENEEK